MFDPDPSFRPVRHHSGYLPLEDLGIIGDGETVALVGLDGSIPWLCLPRFDGQPPFCALLDPQRGGHFTMAPDEIVEARQGYEPDSAVLTTELRSPTGLVRITDALALRSGTDLTEDGPGHRSELVRSAVVLDGRVRLRVELKPRGEAVWHRAAGGFDVRLTDRPDLSLHLRSTWDLGGASSVHELAAGDRLDVVLSWGPPQRHHRHHRLGAEASLRATGEVWRRWMAGCTYAGPQEPLVRRAAITLKVCDHWSSGAMVAAPTSSLPAPIGGVRNWDYRYTWVRDAAFSAWALRRIGFPAESDGFLAWVLDAFEASHGARIMYTVDGQPAPPERHDPELAGYRHSTPVRWGNGATGQRQHDVFGEVLDCANLWVRGGGDVDAELWAQLCDLAEQAADAWHEPDQGIWEVRSEGQVFTYSAAMCHVALDRAAQIAKRLHPDEESPWRAAAEDLRTKVLDSAWDARRQTFGEHLDGSGLDASLLALPLRRVVAADDPRMVATTAAVVAQLGVGEGLLHRYSLDESPDGIEGGEGAFLLCSFWLVDNLAMQGRTQEAWDLYASLCGRASPLGLLPEQIDPSTGAFWGNFPQAFSHIGLISSGVNVALALGR